MRIINISLPHNDSHKVFVCYPDFFQFYVEINLIIKNQKVCAQSVKNGQNPFIFYVKKSLKIDGTFLQ